MKEYVLANSNDGNIRIELEAKDYMEALELALKELGWSISKRESKK